MWYAVGRLSVDIASLFITLVVLLFSLTVHEAAHAWSAHRLGDDTAWSLGRVSLNPAVHIDWIGTVVFPLAAMISQVPVIGWAKPVPVNTARLGHPRRDAALVAAAGPASNLVLAVVAARLVRGLAALVAAGRLQDEASGVAYSGTVLQTLVLSNVMLAIFNLVPLPPLDGGAVVAGMLRGTAAVRFARIRPYGFIVLYGLMLTGILSMLISPPARVLLSWLL